MVSVRQAISNHKRSRQLTTRQDSCGRITIAPSDDGGDDGGDGDGGDDGNGDGGVAGRDLLILGGLGLAGVASFAYVRSQAQNSPSAPQRY